MMCHDKKEGSKSPEIRIEILKNLLELSSRINITYLTQKLNLSRDYFIQLLRDDNNNKFNELILDGEYIIIKDETQIIKFIDKLDAQ